MNGAPLPVNHGYPARIIAPGIAGARCVKWLTKIIVQGCESQNFYQQRDYKILPPEAINREVAEEYWDKVPAMLDMPINSVIAVPQSGEIVTLDEKGEMVVRGYALPQGESGPVVQVEVSSDGGDTWSDAVIESEKKKWCWVLWSKRVKMEKGEGRRLLCRATDTGGNVQPASPEWNLRGVGYNGYGDARDLKII